MNFPSKLVKEAARQLSTLPGVGKKSALRLVLHILKQPKPNVHKFGESFINLINNIKYCEECYSISDLKICEICSNNSRERTLICVVEDIRVMMAIESTMKFNGVYHVLGGLISPLDGIGPSEIKSEELINRIEKNRINEVIFALSSTMEGDTTNYYLYSKIKKYGIKISSIAKGVSIGYELEHTDEITLATAISSRMPYENSLSK